LFFWVLIWLVKLVFILWFKETENSENNGENTQQTNSTNAAATNTTETSSNHTTTQDQLQSVAARSVLEMGYTKEQVLDALTKIYELRPSMYIFMFFVLCLLFCLSSSCVLCTQYFQFLWIVNSYYPFVFSNVYSLYINFNFKQKYLGYVKKIIYWMFLCEKWFVIFTSCLSAVVNKTNNY